MNASAPSGNDRLTTVLDHIQPTVVRRRVVVIDVAADDESPPSSIFLHPGYNLREDDDEEADVNGEEQDDPFSTRGVLAELTAPEDVAPPPCSRPTVEVLSDSNLSTVAKRLGVPTADAVAELVRRGLFDAKPRMTLTAAALTALGDAYHRTVVILPVTKPAKAPSKPARSGRRP